MKLLDQSFMTSVRARINIIRIIDLMMWHIEGKKPIYAEDGETVLTKENFALNSDQIRACEVLLRKALPDLASMELSVGDGPADWARELQLARERATKPRLAS